MAILFDWNMPLGELKREIFRFKTDYQSYDEMLLYDIYDGLIHARHDLFQFFFLRSMGQKWKEEMALIDCVPIELPIEYGRKTPDFVKIDGDKLYIIDFSISVDTHSNSDKKIKKYQPICDYINNQGSYKAMFVHLNIRSDFKNIDHELNKLPFELVAEFETSEFIQLVQCIDDKKITIGKLFDPLKFEEHKKTKYGSVSEELLETNIGRYRDLEVNVGEFKNYNDKFNHEKIIKDSYVGCDIEVLHDALKEVIETPDSTLYRKYKDMVLNDDQFEEAYNTIITRNKIAPKTTAHPSHHLMIPQPEDMQPAINDDIMSDHQALEDMATDFLNFYEKNKHIYHDEKLCFVATFFKIIIDKNMSPDADVMNAIFKGSEGPHKIATEEYKDIKRKRRFVSAFQNGINNSKDKRAKWLARRDHYDENVIYPIVQIRKEEFYHCQLDFNIHDTKQLWLGYYNAKNIVREHIGIKNVISYMCHKGILTRDPTCDAGWIIGNKKVKMPKEKQPQMVKLAFEKAGIQSDVEQKDRRPKKTREAIPIESFQEVDMIIERYKRKQNDPTSYKLYGFLTTKPSKIDSGEAYRMKKECQKNYIMFAKQIMSTDAYKYSHNLSIAYTTLAHINDFKSKNDTMMAFNMGLNNFCCIVALTHTMTEGKPFLSLVKTKNPNLYGDFYGQTYKFKASEGWYYVLSNWRRLNSDKLTYLRDVHTSTFSSTMNTAMSSPNAYKHITTDRMRTTYTLRVLIGYSVNQKTSELLLDTRYAYMSALSKYTNLGKLLTEKFGYNFYTVIEAWIINRLITRLRKINHATMTGGISDLRVTMDGNIRDVSSIGGIINMPGLWVDYDLKDITELLDEAFLYVHTIKEPSNIFHEQIKALQTIVKFQMEYDALPDFIKTGCVDNKEKLLEFLQRPGYVGCCAPIIIDSVIKTINKEKHNFKKYVHELNDENIGDIMTTKAVIADVEREVLSDIPMTKREIKKLIRRQEDVTGEMTEEEKKEYVYYRFKTHSKFYRENKPRQRVWETIIDYLENYPDVTKTVDMANKFLQNPKVIADICIKSQYGGKREFYVVNITAKALARITETFFKKISEKSPNEAISIPGDKKVTRMQSMLDRVHTTLKEYNHEIIYTNGDCTKWSAAETMQSFIAMVIALEKHIPEGLYQVLMATFNAWSDKTIQIPLDIFNKVVPCEEYNTGFLKELKEKQYHMVKSTQNFLQGMFNYSSSYKAVCCTNYAYSLWQKFYPNSKFRLEHLEHSDDYVLVSLYEDPRDFEKFRVLHKMVMRLHGFNDSDRKTCSQEHIMEFVSQMSYNGVMLYPQIKKSKEVNLSLPCTGYTKDMDAALSRVGECQRVGCNIAFLYFFQRLHTYHIAHAYSILPGQRNNLNSTYQDLFESPCELFGIPDPLPLFSTYCRGAINNYRLYTYGGKKIKQLFRYLYKKSLVITSAEGVAVEGGDDRYCLATPRFLYDMGNKSLQNLKKNMNIEIGEIKSFWEKHPVYKIMKPRTREDLITWGKSMFYNRSFMEAYSKTSRAKMTLRLAKYVSTKIISEKVCLEYHSDELYKWAEKLYTVKEYIAKTKLELNDHNEPWEEVDEKHLSRILTKCDPSVSSIYSIIANITMSITDVKRKQTIQVACNSPHKQSTIYLVNDPAIVLQYIMDRENFIKDKRRVISRYSLEKDVGMVIDKYSKEIKESQYNTMALLTVYNDLMINKFGQNITYSYDRKSVSLQDFIISSLQHNYHPGMFTRVTISNRCTVIDPTTLGLLFEKQHRFTKDYHRQCLDNICLIHVYLTHYLNLERSIVLEIMSKIQFDTMEGYKKDIFEILLDLNLDYMNMHNYGSTDRKIHAYLDLYYNNNISSMMELVNTHYAFSYKYNEKAILRGGIYVGRTIVTYTHFNTTIKAYHDIDYGDPVMVCNRHYPTVSPLLYNVALRLTNSITENDFVNNSKADRRNLVTGSQLKQKIQQLGVMFVNKVVKPSGANDRLIRIQEIVDEDHYYPILITTKQLMREVGSNFSKTKAYPTLDDKNLTVKLGKSKLYVLPYWKCVQYDNITLKEDYINIIPLSTILKNRRLEYFLTKPSKLKFDKFELQNVDPREIITIIKETIKKTKLYDFEFSGILKDSNCLKELLDAPGRGHMDKTFLKAYVKEPINEEKVAQTLPLLEENTVDNKPFDFLIDNDGGDILWEVEEGNYEFEMEDVMFDEVGSHDIIDDISEILKEGMLYHTREIINEDMAIISKQGYKAYDNFLIDPNTKKHAIKSENRHKFYSDMGTNYMVLRLNYLPNIFYNLYSINNGLNLENDLLTMYNLRQALQNMVDCFLHVIMNEEDINEDVLHIHIMLEKLLCKTYITDIVDPKQVVGFGYKERKITLASWVNSKGKLTHKQIQNGVDSGKIIEIKENWLLIGTTLDNYIRNVEEGFKTGLLTPQLSYVSKENHSRLCQIHTRSSCDKNEELLYDLMM